MAETTQDLRHLAKGEAWTELEKQIRSVLAGLETDPIAAQSTIACLVHHAFGYLWTGFYRVVTPGKLLRVGPYQGTLGCLEIPFGRGVCGTAAATLKPVLVPDVHAFPGHITCDARSASELVLPVFDASGTLTAVFDLDSDRKAAFDLTDQVHLERILGWFAGR